MRVSLIGLFTKDLTKNLPTSWGELVSFCNNIDEITSSDHERLQQHIKSTLDKRSVLPVPLLELRNALAELQSSIDAKNCEEITQALFIRAYSLIINKIQNELRDFLKIERGNNAPFPDSELDYAIHDDHMAAKIMWNYILLIERIRQNIDINFYDIIGKDTQVVRQYKYLVSGEFSEKFTKLHDESSPFFQSFLTLQCVSSIFATQLYNNASKKYTTLSVAETLLAAFNAGEPAYMLQKFSMEFVWKQIYSQHALTKTQLKDDLKQLTPFHKSKSVTPDAIAPIPSPENEFERKAHALHEKTALAAEQFTLEEEASNIAKSATEIEKDNLPKIDITISQLTLLRQYLENSFPTLTSHTFTRVRIDAVTKKATTELITNTLNQLISDLANLRKQVKEKIDEAAPRAKKIKDEFEKTKSEKAALTKELTQEIDAETKSKEQAEPEKEVKEVKQPESTKDTEAKKYEVDTLSIGFKSKRTIKTPMDAHPSDVHQVRTKKKDEHLDSPASKSAPNDTDIMHATENDAPVDAVPFDRRAMVLTKAIDLKVSNDFRLPTISESESPMFSKKRSTKFYHDEGEILEIDSNINKMAAELEELLEIEKLEAVKHTHPDLLPVDKDEDPLALASVSRAYNVSDLIPVDENEEPIALAAPLRAPKPLVGDKEDKIAILNKPTFWQQNGSSITSGATIILGAVGAAVAASLAWPVFVIAIAIATMLFLPIAAYLLTERFCGVKVEEAKIPDMFTSTSCDVHTKLGGKIVDIASDAESTPSVSHAQQPGGTRIPAAPTPGVQITSEV